MVSRDPRYPLILYLAVPLTAALGTLLCVELCLRWLLPAPFAYEYTVPYDDDPHTGFRPRPGAVGRFATGDEIVINQLGLRGRETTLTKTDGSLRILLLGDSFTFGSNVALEETWGSVLESELRRQTDRPLEVINAGVDGWSPFQYAQYFEHYGIGFSPDVVVLGFFVGNDFFHRTERVEQTRAVVSGRRVRRNEAGEVPFASKVGILLDAHSHLARHLFNRRRFVVARDDLLGRSLPKNSVDLPGGYLAVQDRRMQRNHRPWNRKSERRAENSLRQVRRLQDLTDRRGMRLVIVLLPDENQVNEGLAGKLMKADSRYDLDMPQTLLRSRFAEMGIDVLDLLPDFRAAPRRLFQNDTHFSPAGNALAGRRIAAFLGARLPSPAHERPHPPEAGPTPQAAH